MAGRLVVFGHPRRRYSSAVDPESIAAVAVLNDPTRTALFAWIRRCDEPVTREAAAQAVGISRKLAAFHLDRLVGAGLLETAATTGPRRVGRAPKLYRPADQDVAVSIPPRRPSFLADLLLTAISEADSRGESASATVLAVAEQRGRAVGAAEADRRRVGRLGPERALTVAREVLRPLGYEPSTVDDDALRLRNCPFHRLAREHTQLVCGMNEAFLTGVLDGLRARGVTAVLRPDAATCCVQICRADRSAHS